MANLQWARKGRFRPRSRELLLFGQTGSEVRRNQSLPNTQVPPGTKCYYCGKSGHWKRDCYKRKSEEAVESSTTSQRQKEFTFLAEDPNTLPSKSWVIDLGASQHLCRVLALFITYRNVSNEQIIIIADGTKIHAHGIGKINVPLTKAIIRLKEVWHVPTIGASLISVSRMVDAGYRDLINQPAMSVRVVGRLSWARGKGVYTT